MIYKKIKNFYNNNNVILKSVLWIIILSFYYQELYTASVLINSRFREQIAFHEVLFCLQILSFVFPILFMQRVKLIFGYNNIISRKFTRNEINSSKTLYGLDILLDGERIWVALFIILSLATIPIFSEYSETLFDQLKYSFSQSFFVIFLIKDYSILLILLFLMSSDAFFLFWFWIIILLLFSLGFSFPYLLLAVLLMNFVKLPNDEKGN
jgi:hypothetical protein